MRLELRLLGYADPNSGLQPRPSKQDMQGQCLREAGRAWNVPAGNLHRPNFVLCRKLGAVAGSMWSDQFDRNPPQHFEWQEPQRGPHRAQDCYGLNQKDLLRHGKAAEFKEAFHVLEPKLGFLCALAISLRISRRSRPWLGNILAEKQSTSRAIW